MRARLFNVHSRHNLGDAALVLATTRLLRELWPSLSLDVATRYREDDEWLASGRPASLTIERAGQTPEEAIERYGGFDLVIGSRLHSALLALCAGVPALALGYQPKSAGIYEAGDAASARAGRAAADARKRLKDGLVRTLEPWLPAPERSGRSRAGA